jgi:small-conductance mechanosensitive channel
MKQFFDYVLIDTDTYKLKVLNVFWLVVIFLIATVVVRLTKKVLNKKAESQTKSNAGRYYALMQLIKYSIYFIASLVAFESLGMDLTMMKTGGAALLVGLGFGLQHTFNDFVSGIIILSEGILHVGNIVEIQNIVGRVKHIGLRTSRIETRDGITIIVPNSKLVGDNVVNWSHQQIDRTRFMIRFSVGVDTDVKKVREILLEVSHHHNEVLTNPVPKVRLFDFSESGYVFDLLFWTSNMFFVETLKSDLRFMILEEFKKNNIRISFPHREIEITNRTE